MNFEPQKFFVGLMDFFSILLPGAVLTYLLMDHVGPHVLGGRYGNLACAEAWAAFLFSSYLVGHLIFLLGSWLDEIYDWLRRRTLNAQIKMLDRRGGLSSWPVRALVRLVFKRERNLAVDRAVRIKEHTLEPLQAKDSVNAFQWSKALLNVESPESLAVVQRFEADSKFFRSFAVVLVVVLVAWPLPHELRFTGSLVVVALLLLALWRYMEQRLKATNQAYWSVITLAAKQGTIALEKPPPTPGSPSRAGGVVFRARWGTTQYLLVEASDNPDQWVLPKGHVEDGERHRETAIREVHEETGVWARIVRDLGDVSYTVQEEVITVRFFLMRAVGRGPRKDTSRQHDWLPLEQAKKKASHLNTRELLQAADKLRMQA